MNQYPNIAIIGQSGSGKSSSMRNLLPEETGIINIEKKALPFRNANAFSKNSIDVDKLDDYGAALQKFNADPAIKQIIIESFTSLDEMCLAYCRVSFKGYDIYSNHNAMIRQYIAKTKLKDKVCVLIGIDEIVSIDSPAGGKTSRRALKVEGRELQGTLEKEFTVVFFTEVIKGTDNKMSYKFSTNTDGINSAKSPISMFASNLIDNDLAFAIRVIKDYYTISAPKQESNVANLIAA